MHTKVGIAEKAAAMMRGRRSESRSCIIFHAKQVHQVQCPYTQDNSIFASLSSALTIRIPVFDTLQCPGIQTCLSRTSLTAFVRVARILIKIPLTSDTFSFKQHDCALTSAPEVQSIAVSRKEKCTRRNCSESAREKSGASRVVARIRSSAE